MDERVACDQPLNIHTKGNCYFGFRFSWIVIKLTWAPARARISLCMCVCVNAVVCQAALFNWFILKSSRRFPVKLIPYGGTMNDWKIIRQGRIHEVIYLSIMTNIFGKGIQCGIREVIYYSIIVYILRKGSKYWIEESGNLFIHYSLEWNKMSVAFQFCETLTPLS